MTVDRALHGREQLRFSLNLIEDDRRRSSYQRVGVPVSQIRHVEIVERQELALSWGQLLNQCALTTTTAGITCKRAATASCR